MAARTRRPPAPAAPARRTVYLGGPARGQTRPAREVTPRQAGRGTLRAAQAVTTRRYTAKNLLTAELLAGVAIVAIRVVADYEPQQDGTVRGKVGHPAGQYGPLPILAGLIGTFFLLSFLAVRGGTRAKVAVAGGGLIVLVLGMKSTQEITTVSGTFSSFGKAKTPPGKWQTSGQAAGSPITGSTSGSGRGSGSGSSGILGEGGIISKILNFGSNNVPPGYHQWAVKQNEAIAHWLANEWHKLFG